MRLKVYSSDGAYKGIELARFQYVGQFMGDRTITSSVHSEKKIDWRIGDYVMFRGMKYKIYTVPAAKKQARRNEYGASLVYDDVKFYSELHDLTLIKFKDYVINDNEKHYSGLGTFSFYTDKVEDLGERIMANIQRVFGEGEWQIFFACYNDIRDEDGELLVRKKFPEFKAQSISISDGTSVLDALNMYKNLFDINYVYTKIGDRNTIIVGGEALLCYTDFAYGKDRGLLTIQQARNDSEPIITRLNVYGTDRNMPYRFYNKKYRVKPLYPTFFDGDEYLLESMYVNRLMLPYEKWVQSGHVADAFIESENIEKYGLREGNVTFDGSDTKWGEIYPSLEGLSLDDIKPGMIGYGDKSTLAISGLMISIEDEYRTKIEGLSFNTYIRDCASKRIAIDYEVLWNILTGEKGTYYRIWQCWGMSEEDATSMTKRILYVENYMFLYGKVWYDAAECPYPFIITQEMIDDVSVFSPKQSQIKMTDVFRGTAKGAFLSYINEELIGGTYAEHTDAQIYARADLEQEFDKDDFDAVCRQVVTGTGTRTFVYDNGFQKTTVTYNCLGLSEDLYHTTVNFRNYILADIAIKEHSLSTAYTGLSYFLCSNSNVSETLAMWRQYKSVEYKGSFRDAMMIKILSCGASAADVEICVESIIKDMNDGNDTSWRSNLFTYFRGTGEVDCFGTTIAALRLSEGGTSKIIDIISRINDARKFTGASWDSEYIEGDNRLDRLRAGSDHESTKVHDNGVSADGNYPNGTESINSIKDTDGVVMDAVFWVYIPYCFFNPKDFVGNDTPTLVMKTGMCAGREFEIIDCEKNNGEEYKHHGFALKCKRDTSSIGSMNMMFPNTTYVIKAGDEFVFTGINMPDLYVDAAEQRLLRQAERYLAEHDNEKYDYSIEIDNQYMATHKEISEKIYEGMLFPFNDTDKDDLPGSIGDLDTGSQEIPIKQLTIKYNEGYLPKYEVQLEENVSIKTLGDVIDGKVSKAVFKNLQ